MLSRHMLAAVTIGLTVGSLGCSDSTAPTQSGASPVVSDGTGSTGTTTGTGITTGTGGTGSGAGTGGGTSTGTTASTRLIIRLTGSAAFPGAKGKATYRNRNGERELQVEAENLARLAGQVVTITLGGTRIGSAVVDGLGQVRLNLNSDRGDRVPASVAGLAVQVVAATGAVIAAGSF